jgi:hypothetical protein
MDEWMDEAEKRECRVMALHKKFLGRLDKDLRRLQWFGFVDLWAGVLNIGCALRTFIMGWACDYPRSGAIMGSLSVIAGGVCFWAYWRLRRNVRVLRVLRLTVAGVARAKTQNQFEHYRDQAEAALERLKV